MLTKYERGSIPSPLTIQRLADVLRFPVSFFSGDTMDEPSPSGVSFRSLSSLTARQSHQALASGALALALADWIDARFELPAPDVPRYDRIDPETAAEAVREAWGLGSRPVSNMIHLLEAHGVRVFSLAEECAEVDAFSFWRDSVPYVFLNTYKTIERGRMDAAHELGHLVLHAHGGPTGRQAEHEAYAFGAAFLMPAHSVIARVPLAPSLGMIIDAKVYWKVSALNLARRAHKLDLLTEWQYRSICIALKVSGVGLMSHSISAGRKRPRSCPRYSARCATSRSIRAQSPLTSGSRRTNSVSLFSVTCLDRLMVEPRLRNQVSPQSGQRCASSKRSGQRPRRQNTWPRGFARLPLKSLGCW